MNALAGSPFVPRRNSNLVAGMLALGVHGLFVLMLVFGVSWQTQHPAPVMVDIWQALPKDSPPPAPRPVKTRQPVFKEPPVPDHREADIALEKKKAEIDRLRKLQALQAAEEKALADAARDKQQVEQKKRALLRQMEEEDLKQRIAGEAAANQARLAKLAEAQAKQVEAQARQAEARAAADMRQSEVSRTVGQHRDMISAKVRGNTRLPDNLKGNPEVRCLVKVLPTGEVVSVRVTQSSGNVAYDEAVVRAIEKSSPLPLPTDREARAAFVPELSFVHRPKE
ncbi:MAG: cell envelope integrity protein TolA [Thiobacillus sp.]